MNRKQFSKHHSEYTTSNTTPTPKLLHLYKRKQTGSTVYNLVLDSPLNVFVILRHCKCIVEVLYVLVINQVRLLKISF